MLWGTKTMNHCYLTQENQKTRSVSEESRIPVPLMKSSVALLGLRKIFLVIIWKGIEMSLHLLRKK